MGGDVNTPAEYTARVNLHNMAAVKERALELGITVDESADQILDNLGYPDAITDPFTKEDAQSNSQILNRIYDQSKTTTIQGYQAGLVGKNGGNWPTASYVRQPVQAIVGSDVKSQGIGAWRDGKHEDHNHYGFESTEHRDQAAAWVKSEYKRRWGNEYLLNRDELEINHHEDRQGSSLHGAQGGHRGSDIPRHNFVHGEGETIGANRVHQLYSEWFQGFGGEG